MLQLAELVAALLVILLAADLFTNGIEWVGRLFRLSEGAVGSVLAAVGTALPETLIPLVAILLAGRQVDTTAGHGIGVGAILGAPFMLATLAMFVTGAGVLAYTRRRPTGSHMPVDPRVLSLDIRYFFVAYALAIVAAFVPGDLFVLRYVAVVALLGLYAVYVMRHLQAEGSGDTEDLAPLRLRRLDPGAAAAPLPRLRIVLSQVGVSLAMMLGGAVVFVDAVEHVATGAGLDPALLALVIAPIATELPEKFNSLIWVRQGKDTLALGNITGAMVFQACIPTSIGIILAAGAWTISAASAISFASAGIAFASMAFIFVPMVRRGSLRATDLLLGGAFYLAYLGIVVGHLARAW